MPLELMTKVVGTAWVRCRNGFDKANATATILRLPQSSVGSRGSVKMLVTWSTYTSDLALWKGGNHLSPCSQKVWWLKSGSQWCQFYPSAGRLHISAGTSPKCDPTTELRLVVWMAQRTRITSNVQCQMQSKVYSPLWGRAFDCRLHKKKLGSPSRVAVYCQQPSRERASDGFGLLLSALTLATSHHTMLKRLPLQPQLELLP